MVTQQELYEYAYKIYANYPDYSLEKARRLFPKYYTIILWNYEKLYAEEEQIILDRILAYQQVIYEQELDKLIEQRDRFRVQYDVLLKNIQEEIKKTKDVDVLKLQMANTKRLQLLITRSMIYDKIIINYEFLGENELVELTKKLADKTDKELFEFFNTFKGE